MITVITSSTDRSRLRSWVNLALVREYQKARIPPPVGLRYRTRAETGMPRRVTRLMGLLENWGSCGNGGLRE